MLQMVKMIGKGIRDRMYHPVHRYAKASNSLFKTL